MYFIDEGKQHRGLLGFRECADTGGAQALGNHFALFHNVNLLHIHIPAPTGCLARPGAIIAKLWTPVAIFTLSHYKILPKLIKRNLSTKPVKLIYLKQQSNCSNKCLS